MAIWADLQYFGELAKYAFWSSMFHLWVSVSSAPGPIFQHFNNNLVTEKHGDATEKNITCRSIHEAPALGPKNVHFGPILGYFGIPAKYFQKSTFLDISV